MMSIGLARRSEWRRRGSDWRRIATNAEHAPHMRRPISFALVLTAVLTAALTSACGEPLPFAPAGPGEAPDPAESGPYPVGVRTLELRDPSRLDAMTGEARKLVVEVWYPATERARGAGNEAYPVRDFLPARILDALGDEDVGAIHT